MKKRFLVALILLLFLSTYEMQDDFQSNIDLKIAEIKIENNSILDETTIKKSLSQFYNTTLFF